MFNPSVIRFKTVGTTKPRDGTQLHNIKALVEALQEGKREFDAEEWKEFNIQYSLSDKPFIKVDFGDEDTSDEKYLQVVEQEMCRNFNHVLPLIELNTYLTKTFKDRKLSAKDSKGFIIEFIWQRYGVKLAAGNGDGFYHGGFTLVDGATKHEQQRNFFPGLRSLDKLRKSKRDGKRKARAEPEADFGEDNDEVEPVEEEESAQRQRVEPAPEDRLMAEAEE